MGRLKSTGGFRSERRAVDNAFFSSIHRARVQDLNLVTGKMRVIIEGTRQARPVLMPLLGLSSPFGDAEATQGFNSSWLRYIPQVGDVILVGFDSNGEIYSFGYHAAYYEAFSTMDDAREDRGGIGWGEASGVDLKPGDIHGRSARNCTLYMGKDALFAAGPISLHLRKSQGDATLTSGLLIDKYGEISECRQGNVRRFVLPTDAEETLIPSALEPLQTAQEWTNITRRGSALVIGGIEVSRTSQGEVVDETTMLPMVAATAFPDLTDMPVAGFVRQLETVTDDISGETNLYARVVDNLGNQGVSALTATVFQWFTPLAAHGLTCLSYDVIATEGISFTGATFDITAGTTTVTSADIKLGSSGATSFVLKGTEFLSAVNALYTAVQAAATAAGTPDPSGAAAATFAQAIGVAFNVFNNSVKGLLSTTTKVL